MNHPYIKQYSDGILINPITKSTPYLHKFKSLRGRSKTMRIVNNRKPLSDRQIISRLFVIQKVNKILDKIYKSIGGVKYLHKIVKKKTNNIIIHRSNRMLN